MKPQNHIVTVVITVLALILAGFGLYLLLRAFSFLMVDFDSEVNRMVLAGCATFLLSALIISRGLSRRPRSLDSGASAKEALYDRVLSIWADACRQGRQPDGAESDELERLLVLRASKSVLNCYLAFRVLKPQFDSSDATTRIALQRLITEMRKDLGHQELPWTSVSVGDLLFRQDELLESKSLGSREFKVMTKQ